LFIFNRKANLRAGPDAKFDVVSWAGIGSYATELARKGDWVRVQMQISKRIGWVYNRSLELVKADVNLPVSRVAAGQVAQVAEQSAVRSVIQKAQSKLNVAGSLYLFKQTASLRAGPGKRFDVVAWGGKHETATVIADKGEWRRVRMTVSGKIGWVFNTLLAKAGPDRAAVLAKTERADTPHVQQAVAQQDSSARGNAVATTQGPVYQVARTEPLRGDAQRFAELTGWLFKGESVALLEQRDGWMRVKPQRDGSQAGWVRSTLLKQVDGGSIGAGHAGRDSDAVVIPPSEMLSGADRVVEYQDRISKGEDFNFSYAALEQALYRVPIEDIHVRIARDDLKALFRKDTYDKSSFEIRLKTGRRNLSGRIKVLGSSTRIFKKKSLLIKLDKESSRWYGRRRIALRSMASDKALMREWMAWKMMAAMGMKVPEVHFTRVSFNHGAKTGLYLSVEWMGRQFLAANKLEASGGFYQPNDASHCGDLSTSEHMDLCFDKIAPQDGDYSELSAMAQAVVKATPENIDQVLERYFDADSVINWVAVNALVTNGDTYNKNYWLQYSPTNKKWMLIPWDYNLTFGRVYDPYAQKPFKIFNDNFQYFFPPDVGAGNPLKNKLLRNPKLRAKLEARMKHLIGIEPNGPEETFGWFSPTVMQARIGNLAAVVGKEVYKDTFLTYGEEEFTKTYESLMHYVTAHDHYLKAKLLGPYRWQPSPPFDPSQPAVLEPLPKELYGHGTVNADGQTLHMTDQGWGYFVAHLDLDAPLKQRAEFKVQVEGAATPQYLPPAQPARRCVQRSWLLSTTTRNLSVDGSLMVEYIQENSKRTEVPETLHEELLELWVRDGHHWKPLKTEVNEYANTLTARGVHLESGHVLRFVACSPF
jgi:spore coat protein CotH/SH3-like domain-containing protein